MKHVIYISMLLFSLSACQTGKKEQTPCAPTSVIVNPDSVDIGQIHPHTTHQAQYVIHNTGTETLHITDVLPSCECTTATYERQDTPPGEEVRVTLTYEAEAFCGYFIRTAEVECNATAPVTLTLTGNITDK
ncbi:MAG: DUF1573 domain-containing protein [Paraprevotella sp.]|nr:DUF1573 domain-containing protein [Paraprevotella sp.]